MTNNFRIETSVEYIDCSTYLTYLMSLQTLCISKNLIKGWDRDRLIKINEIEAEQLRQTWLAEECQQAIMAFFAKKQK